MNVWDLFLDIAQRAIDWMKAVTIFYGISAWSLLMVSITLFFIEQIIATIFRHKDGDAE